MFKSIEPAWNDRNLREVAGQIETPVFFAHIRASTGTPVQRSNCHPFRHGRWLWMHNGALRDFHNTKRDLVMAVDPTLYPDIEGSTDSETLFFLALTFGLTDDPFDAVARAIGLWKKLAMITESTTRSRERLPRPTVSQSGPSATPAKARAGRCTSPPTLRHCVNCILRWRSSTAWLRRPGWWFLNHSAISPEPGTRYRSPRLA